MSKTFPFLEVEGNHQKVGEAIGNYFKENIQKDIHKRRKTITRYQTYLAQSKLYYQITQRYFPQYLIELEAIAKAAEVPPLEYFLNNNREVYDQAEKKDRKDCLTHDHCTIIVSFNKEGAIVGHNEDWDKEALEDMYILKAKINDKTILCLNYANTLPGVAAGINNYGLVQCINDLYQTSQMGVPKNFIARAVLDAKDLNEAEHLINSTPRASGFNHLLFQDHECRNIEIAGDKIACEKITQGCYVHTNHYLSPFMQNLEKFHSVSSEKRYQRAKELLQPEMDTKQMMAILSDTHDHQYPICRADETVGSVVFVPHKQEGYFCYGHPCAGEYFKYTLS